MAIIAPDKQIRGLTKFSPGLPDNHINEIADLYKLKLQKMNIDVLDFREKIGSSGIPEKELFYISDHHWRNETAFWAFTELAKFMHAHYDFPLDPFYLDRDNYNRVKYPKSFVGSQAEKAGISFLEIDDFELIYPKFSTDYIFSINKAVGAVNLRGRFERVFYAPGDQNHERPYLNYNSMLWGMQPIRHIQNMRNTKGPKVLVVTDSFGWPVTAFLAGLCSDIWMIDPRDWRGNFSEIIKLAQPDYALVLSTTNAQDAFFSNPGMGK